jgi:hypothetical protein
MISSKILHIHERGILMLLGVITLVRGQAVKMK